MSLFPVDDIENIVELNKEIISAAKTFLID